MGQERGSIQTKGLVSESPTVEVPVTTIDEFLAQKGIDNAIDIIKIDIEGWDFQAILGAEQTLQKGASKSSSLNTRHYQAHGKIHRLVRRLVI
jgi:FkbM family methyltransferase